CEFEAPDGKSDALEARNERSRQVAVDAQNRVDASARLSPVRDQPHVEPEDPCTPLPLIRRRTGPVANPIDQASLAEFTSRPSRREPMPAALVTATRTPKTRPRTKNINLDRLIMSTSFLRNRTRNHRAPHRALTDKAPRRTATTMSKTDVPEQHTLWRLSD